VLRGLRPEVDGIVSPTAVRAFAEQTGIDLANTDDAAAVGFDRGALYLATSATQHQVVMKFMQRSLAEPSIEYPHPHIIRVGGVFGSEHQALITLDKHLVAFASGEVPAVKVVELYARRRLNSATLLRGSSLSKLPAAAHQGLLRLYVPGPLPESWTSPSPVLASRVLALAITLDVEGPDLHTRAYICGAFPQNAEAQVREGFNRVMQSALGRLLGVDVPLFAHSRPHADGTVVTLVARIDKRRFLEGIYALTRGDARDLYRLGKGAERLEP
jgi:hypothetical protein